MNEHELLWAMLPDGLEEYFDVESFEKDDNKFRIVLVEKNILPKEMPAEYHGKKVINTVLNEIVLDDFLIRGLKSEIVLKRRWWKFEGVPRMLMRSLDAIHPSMKFSKDFAAFLKELDRKLAGGDQSDSED
jgi:hypothetical protein